MKYLLRKTELREKGKTMLKLLDLHSAFCMERPLEKAKKAHGAFLKIFIFLNCFFSGLKSQNFEKLLKQKFFLIR